MKVRGDEISFTNTGACVQTGSIEIYALLSLVCGNIFIHYWLAPEGLRFLYCWSVEIGVAGSYNGLLLWPCGHSKLYPVAAADVLSRGGVPFMVLVCQEGVWLRRCC